MTAMNGTGQKTAVAILQIPATGTITAIGYRIHTMTVSDSLDVGIYTVDSSGNPTTTAYGGMTVGNNGSASFTAGGAATLTTGWFTITLGTSCSATVGDVVAIVLSWTSYVSGNIAISDLSGSTSGRGGFPYASYFNATTWTKVSTAHPCASLEYTGTAYNYTPLVHPYSAVATQTYNSGTGVDNEYGLSFQIPVPATIAGIAVNLNATAGATFEVDLYQSGTSTATSQTILVTGNDVAQVSSVMWYFTFTTPQALLANTVYRVTIRPTNTTNVALPVITVPKAQAMDQMGGGQNFMLCSRLNNTAPWDADTTTKRPLIYLNFSKFDDGAGGGGAVLSRVRTGF